MKKQALDELRAKPINYLRKKLQELQKELTLAKLRLVKGELKNMHLPKNLRRNIAQLKTIIKEKEFVQKTFTKQKKGQQQ